MARRFPSISRMASAALFAACAAAQAQTAPSAQEAARYSGLHAAAYRNDTEAIRGLAAGGANLDAKDGHGRTRLRR
jgi:uncharacterized protein